MNQNTIDLDYNIIEQSQIDSYESVGNCFD